MVLAHGVVGDHTSPPPPAEPPPPPIRLPASISTRPVQFPPNCLLDEYSLPTPPSPITVALVPNLTLGTVSDITIPPPPRSVTHLSCTTRVCGLHNDASTSVRIHRTHSPPDSMVDSGSNVFVTGDLTVLLDVVDVDPISISVALDGTSTCYGDCITQRGLLPLSLSDGSTYFQPCYFCANLVETIISPAAILSSSDVFTTCWCSM